MIRMTVKHGRKTLIICSTKEEITDILEETNNYTRAIFEIDLSNFNLDKFLFDKDDNPGYLILIDKKVNYKILDIKKKKYIRVTITNTITKDGTIEIPEDELNEQRYINEHYDEIEFLDNYYKPIEERKIEII